MSDIREFCPLWGEWEADELLGEGSFGAVWRVCRRGFNDQRYYAAVKHISIPRDDQDVLRLVDEGFFTDRESAGRYYENLTGELVSEIDTMIRLQGYTNIVSYEDHRIIPKKNGIGYDVFLRMELLTPLREKMKAGMTTGDVVRLGRDIASAIDVLNSYHLVHRDIKPQNIFINNTGDYKLGDYGTARVLETGTMEMSHKGTYNYMAPEIYKNEKANSLVDIYSLGLVMYRMLNGNRLPFFPLTGEVRSSDSNEALMRRISGEAIPRPRYADEELSRIVLKACAFRPEDRFQTAADMIAALDNYQRKAVPLSDYPSDDETLSMSAQLHMASWSTKTSRAVAAQRRSAGAGAGSVPQAQAPGFAGAGSVPQAQAPGFAGAGSIPQAQAPGFAGAGSIPQAQAPGFAGAGSIPQAQAPGFAGAGSVPRAPGPQAASRPVRTPRAGENLPGPAEASALQKKKKKLWLIPVLAALAAGTAAAVLFFTGRLPAGRGGAGPGEAPWSPGSSETALPHVSAAADTAAPADTPVPAPTDTPVPAPTDTPVPAPTDTPVPAPTDTPVPAPTDTPVPAPTDTPVPAEASGSDSPEDLLTEETEETAEAMDEDPENYPLYGRTLEKKVNVRVRTDTSSKRVAYITNRGTLTEILSREFSSSGEKWYKVKLEGGKTGYVLASVMELQEAAEVARFPFLAKTLSQKINLRTEADKSSRRVTYIRKKGTTVSVLDEVIGEDNKSWYRIQLDSGDIGYARSDLFEAESNSSATSDSAAGQAAGDFLPVPAKLFRDQRSNVYSGPGTQFLRPAGGKAWMNTNESTYVYGQENGWILIQYPVSKTQWRFGYASLSVIADPQNVPVLNFNRTTATVVRKCSMTDDPLHSKRKLASLKLGQTVTCLARLDSWIYVETETARGFVAEECLKSGTD